MKIVRKPRVYISYTWRTPMLKEKIFELAETLRNAGVDSRIDQYYAQSRHGFVPPEGKADDERDAWTIWQEEQIIEADRVLLVCNMEYIDSVEHPDADSGALRDVNFMIDDINSGRAQQSKFIPIGFASHIANKYYLPRFLKGAPYYDVTPGAQDGFVIADLLRRLKLNFLSTGKEFL